jgi:hypothetical protein
MKLTLALLGTLALSVAGQGGWHDLTNTPPTPAATPTGSGGACTPGGCVIEPTVLAEVKRQERPWRNFSNRVRATTADRPPTSVPTPVGSGGMCTSGGCVFGPTATAGVKRQERSWRNFPTRLPHPTTTSEEASTWDLGEHSSTWDLLPTTHGEEKRQGGWHGEEKRQGGWHGEEKRQGGWHGEEKRQGGWSPGSCIVHGFLCSLPTATATLA